MWEIQESQVDVEQEESEGVKEFGLEGKDHDVTYVKGKAEKTNIQKKEVNAAKGKTQETIATKRPFEVEKDDSFIEND